GKPIVFLDFPRDHIKALTTGLGRRSESESGALKRLATWLGGGGGGGPREPGIVHVESAGFDGERRLLNFAVPANENQAGLFRKLGSLFEKRLKWSDIQPRMLEGDQAKALLGDVAWNDATDGKPIALIFSIGTESPGPAASRINLSAVVGVDESKTL